jgi:hypothetical protein
MGMVGGQHDIDNRETERNQVWRRRLVEALMGEARSVPRAEVVTTIRVGKGTVDLTGAKLFLTEAARRQKLIDCVEQNAPDQWCTYNGTRFKVVAAVRLLVGHLAQMYDSWGTKKKLKPEDLAKYRSSLDVFRAAWVGLGWKPTVWVHWVCAHSLFFLQQTQTLYAFSSIPTEHRHQRFKLDFKNTCPAWKFKDPSRCKGFLKRCIELDALDQGLRALALEPTVERTIFKSTNRGKRRKLQ